MILLCFHLCLCLDRTVRRCSARVHTCRQMVAILILVLSERNRGLDNPVQSDVPHTVSATPHPILLCFVGRPFRASSGLSRDCRTQSSCTITSLQRVTDLRGNQRLRSGSERCLYRAFHKIDCGIASVEIILTLCRCHVRPVIYSLSHCHRSTTLGISSARILAPIPNSP